MTTNNGTADSMTCTMPAWFEDILKEEQDEQEHKKSIELISGIQERAEREEVPVCIKSCMPPPKMSKKRKAGVRSLLQIQMDLEWSEMNGSGYMEHKMDLQAKLMTLKKNGRLFKKTKLMAENVCDKDELDEIMHQHGVGLRDSTEKKTCEGIEKIVGDVLTEDRYDSWFEDDF
tara:strand:+ start:88 stop:609 length:522 start_codon:yes stop_codon:yes gene_type:complete